MKILIIQIINYTLSFLMWMIIGRAILTLMLGQRQNVMTNAFAKVTEPVYKVVRRAIPFTTEKCAPAIAVMLIIFIRLALIIIARPGLER